MKYMKTQLNNNNNISYNLLNNLDVDSHHF